MMTTKSTPKFAPKLVPKLAPKTWQLPLVLLILCLISTYYLIKTGWLDYGYSLSALFANGDALSLEQLATQLALLPTMTVAILAGGLLGVASTLLQQLIKNPLASDTTLSVGSGGQLALLLVTLFLPNVGLYGSFWVAFVGSLLGMAVVFFLAKGSRGSPVVLILSGLVVNILVGAVASLLILLYSDYTLGVRLWGAGDLVQTSWQGVMQTFGTLMFVALALVPLYKPLSLMSLDDRTARSLGVPVVPIRLAVIVLVAVAVAVVTSLLGMLAFIGLASASLANALAFKSLKARLVASGILGGLILWLTANISALLTPHISFMLPAGTISAVLGTPLVLWLVLKSAKQNPPTADTPAPLPLQKTPKKLPFVIGLIALTALALLIAPQVTIDKELTVAWGIAHFSQFDFIAQYRLPRTLSAMAVGAMLAVAGTLLQTLTKNPMASPEVLGVSSGAGMGVVGAFWLLPMVGMAVTPVALGLSGVMGAGVVLLVILALMSRISESYLLLVGVAISALMGVVMSLIGLSGNPALSAILSYLSGSTYHANPASAWYLCVVAVVLFGLSCLIIKPLSLMGLGAVIARGRGVPVKGFRLGVLSLIAILSAVATLAVGPLSFVGLMIPHLASRLGAVKLSDNLPLSALLGAMLMLIADWVGRYAMFPYEIPAGTIASLVGGGYFVYLMYRTK